MKRIISVFCLALIGIAAVAQNITVKGTVKVFRKGNIYKFTWDLQDDAESPNKITGAWEGQLKRLVSVDQNN